MYEINTHKTPGGHTIKDDVSSPSYAVTHAFYVDGTLLCRDFPDFGNGGRNLLEWYYLLYNINSSTNDIN